MKSEQGGRWQKVLTPELKQSLIQSANACIANGDSLLSDAEFLNASNRYARAASLSVLAIEEYGKALHLVACITIDRWDAEMHKAITQHNSKQTYTEVILALPEGLLEYLYDALGYGPIAVTLNKISIIKKNLTDQIEAVAHSSRKKGKMDKLKQRGFYVGITANATINSQPDSISQQEAYNIIGRARAIQQLAVMHIDSYQQPQFIALYNDILSDYRRYLRQKFPTQD